MSSSHLPAAHVLSTNVAEPQPDPGGDDRVSGIQKVATEHIEVFAPGPDYGDGSGVRGDVIGDSKHHGGQHKAVYAFAREELDYWGETLSHEHFPNGHFGENLTTVGVDWASVVIGQWVGIGGAILEVSVPRQPCRTFGAWLDQRGWMKTFVAHAECGCYFRVIQSGHIAPGDELHFHTPPRHGITMQEAFLAKMGNKDLARRVVEAHCLPGHHHQQLVRLVS